MKIEALRIGDLIAPVPVVQGGMGVGVSLARLAAAVANCGGVGVVSGVETGFYRNDYSTKKREASALGLVEQLEIARQAAPQGVIGVNIMVALSNYGEMVQAAIQGKADIIFSGAGLPLDLPEIVGDSNIKLAPIVSSGRAASLICRHWKKRHGRLPDAFVLEGPLAGGHLGYSREQLQGESSPSLIELIKELRAALEPFEESRPIPIIAGGGLWTGSDIAQVLQAGANAAQLGSRFVPTVECDASDAFKQEYLRASKDDIVLIDSPVGMPGRAIRNSFLNEVAAGLQKPVRCAYNCLRPCKPKEISYCIASALINAQQGKLEHGFAFAGSEAWRAEKITSVADIFGELIAEIEQA